jgi:hypothetical protein
VADDEDKFETPEEVAASGAHDSTLEGTGNPSPLDWHGLFPTVLIMTRPATTLNNKNAETPSPCAIDVATNPQHYLHGTDDNQLVMEDYLCRLTLLGSLFYNSQILMQYPSMIFSKFLRVFSGEAFLCHLTGG